MPSVTSVDPKTTLARTRAEAAIATAGLQSERLDAQIAHRDLSPFERGNNGIPYAFSFDSGEAGPHILITCLAHGNEPGGLEAVVQLLESGIRPSRGRLSFAICNVAAYNSSNGVDPYGTRFVDEDFNRVWADEILDSSRTTIELDRARELRPLVSSADVLLDLHATPYEATPFHVLRPGSRSVALARSLGPRTCFVFQQGSAHSPTLTNYNRFRSEESAAIGLTVECGLFFARSSQDVALTTALELLLSRGVISATAAIATGMTAWRDPAVAQDLSIEEVQKTQTGSVLFLSRPGDFQRFGKGEITAFDGAEPILGPFDNAIPVWIKQTMVAGEQAFMWARQVEGTA